MKKQLLPVVALLTGLLVACGGTATESKAPSKAPTSKTSTSKHEHTFDETKWEANDDNHWHPATCGHDSQKTGTAAHTYVEDTTQAVTATCKQEGKKVEKCSVCQHVKTTVLPKAAHKWVDVTPVVKEGYSKFKTQRCETCQIKDVVVDALSWTEINGSNKDSKNETLKLNKNGDYVNYKIEAPAAFNGKVYLYGWVDYWKDGSNNNDQRGFFSRKEGEGFNFELTVGGTMVQITNLKTFEEMGMTEGENGNGSFTLCEVGACTFAAGDVEINYKRIESYNLNITEIHFIA